MAGGVTRLSDLIVPEIFTPYVQNYTTEKSAIIRSGAMTVDPMLNSLLSGAGLTFQNPSFRDLDNDPENVSSDDPAVHSVPNKIGTLKEIQVRLSRNNSWSSMDLASTLIGADPMTAIGNLTGNYWTRRLQRAFVATMGGVFAQNATATNADHVQNDLTYNVSGTVYAPGVTDFSAQNFINAALTMGDAADELGLVLMHSVVYARMQVNNLIDFIPDAEGRISIATFLGRRVIQDDMMPNSGGVFETWIFGQGAMRFGQGSPEVPTETDRHPTAGNGGGQEVLFNRVEWLIHPVGHAYVGTPPDGGPSNANTAGNLGAAASWKRVFPERKQIKMARLITREYAA